MFSSTLIIEELALAASGSDSILRVLVLQGPSLPFMGANWDSELNLITTWYPGNQDEATQQNMGRRELPSNWSGEWNRTRMGRTPAEYSDVGAGGGVQGLLVAEPFLLWQYLDGIYSGGRRLRVTWETTQDGNAPSNALSGSIIREGRMKYFKAKFRTLFDIEWEIQFDWVSRGKTTARVASTRNGSVTNLSSLFATALNAVSSANAFVLKNVQNPIVHTLGQLETLESYPSQLMNIVSSDAKLLTYDLQALVTIANTLSSTAPNTSPSATSKNLQTSKAQPAQIASSALDIGRNVLRTATQSFLQLSAVPVEAMSTQADAVSMLSGYQSFSGVQQASLLAAGAAWTFLQQIRATLPVHASSLTGELNPQQTPSSDTILATYQVKQGDTMHRISQRFYGTPDNSQDICKANRLSWHTFLVPSGTILIIPRLSSISQSV